MAKGTDPGVPTSPLPNLRRKVKGMESGNVRSEPGFPDEVTGRVVQGTVWSLVGCCTKGEEGPYETLETP